MKKQPWWSGLNEVWSEEKTIYLTAGSNMESDGWLGDFIFHRFYSTDNYDPVSYTHLTLPTILLV